MIDLFYVIIIAFELLLLFLLHRKVVSALFRLFYKFSQNRKTSFYLLSLVFLPGTFIHELSHFLVALFLLVPVSTPNLMPQITDDEVILGTVGIAKTDPVRRFLIGVAPVIIGNILLFYIVSYTTNSEIRHDFLAMFFILILIFQISNTLFSSKRDMEGALEFLVIIIIFVGILQFVEVRLPTEVNGIVSSLIDQINILLPRVARYLIIPIVLNFVLVLGDS